MQPGVNDVTLSCVAVTPYDVSIVIFDGYVALFVNQKIKI
jgi:hypothetical protein